LLIYIIDNSQSYRKLVETCLEALNFTDIKTYDDSESCFTNMDQIPDIIILDYNLGDGRWNGLEFMSEFSRLSKNTRFIFLSSNTKIDIAVDSVRMGAVDYIIKSKSGLMRLVKQVDLIRNSMQAKTVELNPIRIH
jgi:two-component system, OmpR family, response regulator